jgi:hypothetical protein
VIESQDEELTKEQLQAISAGARMEQQHKPSEQFETIWAKAKECELIGLKSLGGNIQECYDQEIKDGNSADVARAITVGRFARYRSIARIVHHLPQDSKDEGRIKGANASNIKQERVKDDMARNVMMNARGGDYEPNPKEIKTFREVVKVLRKEDPNQSLEDRMNQAARMVAGIGQVIKLILHRKEYYINQINSLLAENPAVEIAVNLEGNIVGIEAIKEKQKARAAVSPAL